MLILVSVAVVEASTRSAVWVRSSAGRATSERVHVVGLAVLLDLGKYTETTLRWNETRYNFLSNIFS